LAQPTVEDLEPLAHRTLSGAPIRPLARPRVTRGLRGLPLVRPTVGSPDSPVNFSRTPLITSRERRLRRGWITGQSGAPPNSSVIYSCTPPSSPESGLFTETGPGAPDTVRCTQTEAVFGCTQPTFFSNRFLLFLALIHNTLVLKTMY
jgi:hypothetical protein